MSHKKSFALLFASLTSCCIFFQALRHQLKHQFTVVWKSVGVRIRNDWIIPSKASIERLFFAVAIMRYIPPHKSEKVSKTPQKIIDSTSSSSSSSSCITRLQQCQQMKERKQTESYNFSNSRSINSQCNDKKCHIEIT